MLVLSSLRTLWSAFCRRKLKPLTSSVVLLEGKSLWKYLHQKERKQGSLCECSLGSGTALAYTPRLISPLWWELLGGFCHFKGKSFRENMRPRETWWPQGTDLQSCQPASSPPVSFQASGSPSLPPQPQLLLVNILAVEHSKRSAVF